MNSEIEKRIEQIDQGIVPEGYKKTKVGIIPEDWEIKKLEDIVTFLNGKRIPVKESDRSNMQGVYPYYGASGIIDYVDNYLFDEELILLGEDGANILTRSSRLAFLASGKYWVNNHAHVMKGKEGINQYFLSEKLESLDYNKYNTGTAQPKLNQEVCRNIEISTPTSNEQEKIADILSLWDEAIQTTEKLIKEKEVQKKGLMQELLTGKTRLPGFNGEWEEVKLGDIGEIRTSSVNKKIDDDEKKISLLNYMDVYNNKHINSEINFQEVTATDHQIETNDLMIGDILFTPSSETRDDIGHSSVVIEDIENLLYSYHLVRYRLNTSDLISLNYKAYCFNNADILKEFSKLSTGSTRYTLSKADFENTKIKLPSLAEQKAIATILSDADKEIELLKQLLASKKQEKKGLMQVLLTGIARV